MHRRLLNELLPAAQPSLPPGEATTGPRIPWARLTGWFLLSRVLIWTTAAVSLHLMPPGRFFEAPRSALQWLIHWDAGWFRDVIQNGYAFHTDRMSNVNFLPAYPLLVRTISWAMPVELAGYLVTAAACLLGGALLWRITERIDHRERAADGAVLFYFFGPVSVFFATLYSEATFVLFAVLSVYAAHRDRWVLAGICGALAALSRSVGLLLVVPLVLMHLQRHATLADWRRPRTWLSLAACGLPALGTAMFTTYLGWRFGEPKAYLISHHFAGHSYGYFWKLFKSGHFIQMMPFYQVWFTTAVLAGFVLTLVGTLLRQPLPFTLFSLAMCLLYVSMRSLEGMPRFMSIVFPLYCTLGQVWCRWPRLGGTLLAISIILAVFSTCLFVNGYWFT